MAIMAPYIQNTLKTSKQVIVNDWEQTHFPKTILLPSIYQENNQKYNSKYSHIDPDNAIINCVCPETIKKIFEKERDQLLNSCRNRGSYERTDASMGKARIIAKISPTLLGKCAKKRQHENNIHSHSQYIYLEKVRYFSNRTSVRLSVTSFTYIIIFRPNSLNLKQSSELSIVS